jgi:DNA-binding LacI/PurR family transcriptional regulator
MPSPVTMADIARRAGVSTATVSLSLRNQPDISPQMRARVQALARRLGYKPNPYISALMRSRRHGRMPSTRPVLALICALDRVDGWRNSSSPTRRAIREGALARAGELGYSAQEFWLHQDGMSPERFSAMLHARGIQGLILGPQPDGAAPPRMQWQHFSAVTLSVPLPFLPLHAVCHDQYFSVLRAMQECARMGYRRPGLVLRRSHREFFQGRWEAGFWNAQQSVPGLASVPPFFPENLEDRAAFEDQSLEEWLVRRKPDVILTLAFDFVEAALRRLGRRVPQDVGLVGLSCPEIGSRMTGIHQHGMLLGATAVDVLIGMIERHETGLPQQATTTMVEGLWNPGATVRPQ